LSVRDSGFLHRACTAIICGKTRTMGGEGMRNARLRVTIGGV